MKHEFKEGQWFDIRKLTDWQKQWCLVNLEFLTLSAQEFKEGFFYHWLYQRWEDYDNTCCFGSASKSYISSENEITFNDFYWGEDEDESFDNLVYVKPNLPRYDNWVIKLNNLSEDQLIFISEYFKTDCRYSPSSNTQDVVMSCLSGKDSRFVWTNNTKNFMPSTSSHYVSFNDIFKEVS